LLHHERRLLDFDRWGGGRLLGLHEMTFKAEVNRRSRTLSHADLHNVVVFDDGVGATNGR
jgi:hypothetical protein